MSRIIIVLLLSGQAAQAYVNLSHPSFSMGAHYDGYYSERHYDPAAGEYFYIPKTIEMHDEHPKPIMGGSFHGWGLNIGAVAEQADRLHVIQRPGPGHDYRYIGSGSASAWVDSDERSGGTAHAYSNIEVNLGVGRYTYRYAIQDTGTNAYTTTGLTGTEGVMRPGNYQLKSNLEATTSGGSVGKTRHIDMTMTKIDAHLVVFAHGWKPVNPLSKLIEPFWPGSEDDNFGQWTQDLSTQMNSTIAQNVEGATTQSHQWTSAQVLAGDITQLSRTEGHGQTEAIYDVVALDWSTQSHELEPRAAANNGMTVGQSLGQQIAGMGYDSVHLIGHSAGSWLIDAASDAIKDTTADMHVQLTFLDAYTPNVRHPEGDFSIYDLGDTADYAEHYIDDGWLPYTSTVLPHAFNIDVTGYAGSEGGHGWPIAWYEQSAAQANAWGDELGMDNSIVYTGELPRGFGSTLSDGTQISPEGTLDLRNGGPMRFLPDRFQGTVTQNFTSRNPATPGVRDETTSGFTMDHNHIAPQNEGLFDIETYDDSAAAIDYTLEIDSSQYFGPGAPIITFDEPTGTKWRAHFFRFDYVFHGLGDSLLLVYYEDEILYGVYEPYVIDSQTSRWLYLGTWADDMFPVHELTFQLVSEGTGSILEISQMQMRFEEADGPDAPTMPIPAPIAWLGALPMLGWHLIRRQR